MVKDKKFLVDVGIMDLPFPIKVISKTEPKGQATIANISINARIMQEFEARWIDRFIHIVQDHRDNIGTDTLRTNIFDYVEELKASSVFIQFEYPFFIEKITPVSKEKSLVKYLCHYSAKADSSQEEAKIIFKMQIPCITTYPGSASEKTGGLFGQLSMVTIEIESKHDFYPEDLVEIVDSNALAPVYSFLAAEDEHSLIQKIHSKEISSVSMMDKIKSDLAANSKIEWYSVRCNNYGMLHSYSTMITTEKSRWVPFSGYSDGEEEI
jgi:GTP cyclohydrolase I